MAFRYLRKLGKWLRDAPAVAGIWLRAATADAGRALATLSIILAVLLSGYGAFKLFWAPSFSIPWDKALRVSEIGYMEPKFDDAELSRYFRQDRINEIERRIQDELREIKAVTLPKRINALNEAGHFACGALSNMAPPPILALAGATMPLPNNPCVRFVNNRAPTSLDYQLADFAELIAWLESVRDHVHPEKLGRYYYTLNVLRGIDREEKKIIEGLRTDLRQIDTNASFSWLANNDQWVLELFFWSIIGVLVNSIAAVMSAIKDPEQAYHQDLLLLTFPKLLIAPVIAIVIVATIVYGLTDQEINLSHQPMLLFFAFISGFASERFSQLLRDGVNNFIPGLRLTAEKIKGVVGIPYRWRYQDYDVQSWPAPNGVISFRKKLEAAAQAVAEGETVDALERSARMQRLKKGH